MSRKLIVNDGRRERELLLIGTMVVGRDPTCDISDADPLLSRRHVEFVSGEEVLVRDLGSRNGILVNGVKAARSVLHGGDVVQVGHLQMRLVEDAAPSVAPPEFSREEAGRASNKRARSSSASSSARRPAVRTSSTSATDSTSIEMEEPTERILRLDYAAAPAARFVMTQSVALAAVVFIATAMPLIVWPPAKGDIAIVLAPALIVTMIAVWFTSRRIHRHLSSAFAALHQAPGNSGSVRSSAGREI